jgi:nucleoside 2-deoxyribosyltransferase
MTQPYTIYFAGELFSLKHLIGNALLADAINTLSESRYRCIVPQDLEQRETTALAIRDQDLFHVISCDLGLFHFDGPELDSGTVVEFMVAKMLDIPSVILRSDFRSGGDAKTLPWNLMASGYPRTEIVVLDGMLMYQKHSKKDGLSATDVALQSTRQLAHDVIVALDKVRAAPCTLSADKRECVYDWISQFAGPSLKSLLAQETLHDILSSKIAKGLL